MGDDEMGPLQEASLDDLLDELGRRMDHAVFAGLHVKQTEDSASGSSFIVERWSTGNHITCIGLATEIGIHVREKTRTLDDDEGEEWKSGGA